MNLQILICGLVISSVALGYERTGNSICGDEDCSLGPVKRANGGEVVQREGKAIEVRPSQQSDDAGKLSATEKNNLKAGAPITASRSRRKTITVSANSNLPGAYHGLDRSEFKVSEDISIVPNKPLGAPLVGMKSGDAFTAFVTDRIEASQSKASPITARIVGGAFKNALFFGEALYDASKAGRVLINFTQIRMPGRETTYSVKAEGKRLDGSIGLEGEHHTNEVLYAGVEGGALMGSFLFDTGVTRTQNNLGTYQDAPDATNRAKAAAGAFLGKEAERFGDRAKNAPAYTTVDGNQEILVLVTSNPTEAAE